MKTPPWLTVAPGSIRVGGVVELDPAEGRHVSGPLRLREGAEVVLADGAGRIAPARLVTVGKAKVRAEVTCVQEMPEPVGDGVTLAVAILDQKAMDWAVQKSVENGIRRFQPIVSDRTQAGRRVNPARTAHWRRVALQALKQCRRPWAMTILEVQGLTAFVENQSGGGVVADPDGVTIGSLRMPRNRILVVGPEGGFSAFEKELLTTRRWARLRLSANILRSETATVVGGAMMVAHDEGWLVSEG